MSVTIHDSSTVAALAQATGVGVELRDGGRLLSRFTPAPRPGMMFPEFGMTDEEIEKADTDPNAKWYPADEVLARLRSIQGDD